MPRSSSDKVHPQPGSRTAAAPGTRAGNEKASARPPQTSVHPIEPDDAKLTGTSQSQSRALGLNVDGREAGREGQPGHQAEEHPSTPAGQHATGSFTDKKRRRGKAA